MGKRRGAVVKIHGAAKHAAHAGQRTATLAAQLKMLMESDGGDLRGTDSIQVPGAHQSGTLKELLEQMIRLLGVLEREHPEPYRDMRGRLAEEMNAAGKAARFTPSLVRASFSLTRRMQILYHHLRQRLGARGMKIPGSGPERESAQFFSVLDLPEEVNEKDIFFFPVWNPRDPRKRVFFSFYRQKDQAKKRKGRREWSFLLQIATDRFREVVVRGRLSGRDITLGIEVEEERAKQILSEHLPRLRKSLSKDDYRLEDYFVTVSADRGRPSGGEGEGMEVYG
ncbi:MAG: hypothetical protein GF333_05125 [Candidatus Omnitrophica bacterium]|nr:hypothetical protein [Candidatus Omnitrophota bacterium]